MLGAEEAISTRRDDADLDAEHVSRDEERSKGGRKVGEGAAELTIDLKRKKIALLFVAV